MSSKSKSSKHKEVFFLARENGIIGSTTPTWTTEAFRHHYRVKDRQKRNNFNTYLTLEWCVTPWFYSHTLSAVITVYKPLLQGLQPLRNVHERNQAKRLEKYQFMRKKDWCCWKNKCSRTDKSQRRQCNNKFLKLTRAYRILRAIVPPLCIVPPPKILLNTRGTLHSKKYYLVI